MPEKRLCVPAVSKRASHPPYEKKECFRPRASSQSSFRHCDEWLSLFVRLCALSVKKFI